MDEVIRRASDLGKLIAQSERFKHLRASENAVEGDIEARDFLESMERLRLKISELERQQKPVSPEDKTELQRLAQAVHSHPKLQELARAQADYLEMMNQVNRQIREELDASAK